MHSYKYDVRTDRNYFRIIGPFSKSSVSMAFIIFIKLYTNPYLLGNEGFFISQKFYVYTYLTIDVILNFYRHNDSSGGFSMCLYLLDTL